jgi:hypothetical protein
MTRRRFASINCFFANSSPASFRQLALFLARQQAAVADRPDVKLQGIIELACWLVGLLDVSLRSEERLHPGGIGSSSGRLEA